MNCRTVKIKSWILHLRLWLMERQDVGLISHVAYPAHLFWKQQLIVLQTLWNPVGRCHYMWGRVYRCWAKKYLGVVVYTQQYPGVMVHKPYCVNYVRVTTISSNHNRFQRQYRFRICSCHCGAYSAEPYSQCSFIFAQNGQRQSTVCFGLYV